MITGEIKQKVDAVWQTFWNGGFTAFAFGHLDGPG